jgi:hypothetical protein
MNLKGICKGSAGVRGSVCQKYFEISMLGKQLYLMTFGDNFNTKRAQTHALIVIEFQLLHVP